MTAHRRQCTKTGLVGTLAAATLGIAGCGDGERYRVVATADTPAGELVFETAPAGAGGPAELRVRRAGEDGAVVYVGEIANAGEAIGPGNIQPESGPGGVLWLCLNGTGQPDLAVTLNLDTGLVIEDPRPCRH